MTKIKAWFHAIADTLKGIPYSVQVWFWHLRNRLRRRFCRSESYLLAQKIYEIQNANWKSTKQWILENRKEWVLADGVRLEQSEDLLVWYVWKLSYWGDEECFKAVPRMGYYPDEIERILKSQAWCHL